ncbi:MAG: Hpt domain-containing protein [Deltaproteobacteria bacterium]|nr:Hpt domain-containing protein [Deltaproteobacteria bacterium]
MTLSKTTSSEKERLVAQEIERELADLPTVDEGIIDRLRQLQASVSRPGEDIVAELVRLFKRDSSSHLERIQKARVDEDLSVAVSSAHALKGASVAVGALRVAQVCAWLEVQVKGGRQKEVLIVAEAIDQELSAANAALGVIVDEQS